MKIADFGLAKLLRHDRPISLTAAHQVMGTLRYMAPEQMEGATRCRSSGRHLFARRGVLRAADRARLPMGRFDPPSKKVQIDVRLDEVVLRRLGEGAGAALSARQRRQDRRRADLRRGAVGAAPAFGREYRSKATLFGLPLVHIAFGIDPTTGRKRIAKGLFAIGDIADGVFAFGGVAMGGIVWGGMSIGLVSIGGLALGMLFAFGGLAIGGFSFGGASLGVIALGRGGGRLLRDGWQCLRYPSARLQYSRPGRPKVLRGAGAHNWWQQRLTAAGVGLPVLYLILFAVVWVVLKREEAKRNSSGGGSTSSFR